MEVRRGGSGENDVRNHFVVEEKAIGCGYGCCPNRWVDVESVLDISRQAIMGNTLEDTKAIWADHETCARFRGAEYGCRYAEAFVRIVTVSSVTGRCEKITERAKAFHAKTQRKQRDCTLRVFAPWHLCVRLFILSHVPAPLFPLST
jgi:hypothetical protein